jgi:hypothetical protein
MKSSTTGFDPAAYFRFISQIELSSIALIRSNARIDRDAYLAETETLNTISSTFGKPEFTEQGFLATTTMSLGIKPTKNAEQILDISCDFCLKFSSKIQPDDEFLRRFMTTEARLMTWPYFREFVGNLTARMNIIPITLPMIKRGFGLKSKAARSKRALVASGEV